jgi:type I restriction enzyme S subunit
MNKDKLIPELRFPEFENDGEWDKPKLSSVSDVIMGSSPSSLSYNENKIGLPLLQGNADIKNRLSTPRIYTTEITKECEIGDILLSVRAPVGTVAKSLHNACIGRGISALSAKKPNSQEYIYQWLFSYESSWAKISQGGTFDAVNSDDIKNLLVPIPKPKEQQKIASCLSSLDALITAQSEKIEQLKLLKKGLMQNLFPQEGEKVPKYRFKEFENDGEWVEEPLSSKVSVIDGDRGLNYPKAEEYSSDGYCLFLSAKNVTKSGFLFNEFQFITKEKDELLRKGKLARFDIVLTTRGSLGQFAFFDENIQFENIRINSGMVILRAKDNGINPNYLYSYFNSYSIQSAIKSQGFGNAVQQLTVAVINNFTLRYPYDPKEQQKIASCLSSLDSLITAQVEKIEQLKLHKKGLMQGLFPKINE